MMHATGMAKPSSIYFQEAKRRRLIRALLRLHHTGQLTVTLFLAVPRTQPHNYRYNHLAITVLQLLTDAKIYAYVQV